MKKSIFILLSVIIFTSCKKSRTCTCDWTAKQHNYVTGNTNNLYGTKKITINKSTKKSATKGECSSYVSTEQYSGGTSTPDGVYDYSQTCKLD